jgi:hypothetical protein
MSRKRTSDQTPATDTTPEPPASEAGTAVADPPAPANDNGRAANDNQPGFVGRVGQKQRPSGPDPFPIATDRIAGVKLYESRQDGQMAIKFDEKPPQPVIDRMHDARWIWKRADGIWAFPVRPGSAMSTRIEAEQLFQEVRKMIRHEKGLEPSQEVPF